jgi:putative ABC transport system permease protein
MLFFTLRSIWRGWRAHLSPTLINLTGLALGLAGCLLVTAYVLDELDYDRYHTNADRLVLLQQFESTPTSGGKFATDLKARFAPVEQAVRLTRANLLMASQAFSRYEPNVFFADSSLFSVFSFRLTAGDPRTALRERDGVVLSAELAGQYFPGQNPLGQTLRCGPKATPLHVTGVLAPTPSNTHLRPDLLIGYARANDLVGYDVTTNYWGGGDTRTYLLLSETTTPATLAAQLPAYVKSLGDPNAAIWKMALVPLRDLYLRTNLIAQNRLTYVYTFALVALLILGLAVFNYINLTTARALTRAKEVGVRKSLGAHKGQLWGQFLTEAGLAVGVALLLGTLLAALMMPLLNTLAGKALSVTALITPGRVAAFGLGTLALVLVAGTYPAWLLTRYQPVAALRGAVSEPGRGQSWLRQGLVVGQFAVSVGMVVATLVVYTQLRYVQQTSRSTCAMLPPKPKHSSNGKSRAWPEYGQLRGPLAYRGRARFEAKN